ncbi:MAG: precorrin-2 C(20)-methyltransferase [Deferribacterota bacterium]|nr:precorrin-2 C(20)-methyltransferase [Deferribacterota bacterium]
MNKKCFYAIGLGPGDPELLTYKAIKVLNSVDLVIVPESSKNGRSIALDIIKKYIPTSKIETFYFPMINDPKVLDKKYFELSKKIKDNLYSNKHIAYVTIGDLSIYSTFIYLWNKLKLTKDQVEFIPGIPSFISAASIAYMPIVMKNENFCVIEMPNNEEKLLTFTKLFQTIIIMKIYKKAHILSRFLEKYIDILDSAVLVQKATLKGECVVDLLKDNILNYDKTYLSTVIMRTKHYE